MSAGVLSDKQYRDRVDAENKRIVEQAAGDLRSIMDEEGGRRFIYWLIFAHLGLQDGSFLDETKDGISAALRQAWRDGPRHKARELHNQVRDQFPRQFLAMMAEQIAEAERVAAAMKAYQLDAEQDQEFDT